MSDESLTTIPLDNPETARIRSEAYNGRAPFKPTSIRIQGSVVQCWTGALIAPILIVRLGAEKTTRIIQVLGIERSSAGRKCASDSVERRFSRRAFAQVATGVIASVGILMTGSLSGVARAGTPVQEGKTVPLSLSMAERSLRSFTDNPDVRNIASDELLRSLKKSSLMQADSLGKPVTFIQASPENSTTVECNEMPGTGYLGFFSHTTNPDGTSRDLVAVSTDSDNDLLAWTMEHSDSGSSSTAKQIVIDSEAGEIEFVLESLEGEIVEAIPDGQLLLARINVVCVT